MTRAILMLCAAIVPLTSGCIRYSIRSDGIARATFGETVNVGGETLTPLALVEDSRCREGTQCLWAGRVRISVRYGDGRIGELTLGDTAAPGAALVEVSPGTRGVATLYPEDYRFGFRPAT